MSFRFGEETEFFKFGFGDTNSLSGLPIFRSKTTTPALEPPAISQSTSQAIAQPPKPKMAPSNAHKASVALPRPFAGQPPPSKYENAGFEAWVRAQDIQISREGVFMNKKSLKKELIAKCRGSTQEDRKKATIRQVINQIGREINLGQLPARPPSFRQSTFGFQPTSTSKEATKQVEVKVKAKTVTAPSSRMDSDSEMNDSDYTDSDESTEPVTPIKTAINGQSQSSSLHQPLHKDYTTGSASPEDEEHETPANDPQSLSNPKISELNAFLHDQNIGNAKKSRMFGGAISTTSTLDQQLELLNFDSEITEEAESSIHNVKNAVLFSGTTLDHYGHQVLPQYGLLGSSASTSTKTSDGRLFLNTNIPFSAFICGVQGSGKSHSTACVIENCLIPSPLLGNLQRPLSALVFNFAEYSSHTNFRPSELAFLASPNKQNPNHLKVKKVNVLVSPSNYHSLNALYSQIPGVSVQPFLLRPHDMNIATMLTLMSVDHTQAAPLYLGTVTKVLREMAAQSSGSFIYPEFRRRLDEAGFDRKQLDFLNQRLDLLESFMDLEGATTNPTFNAGEITIIDLSCPFLDASTACVLFKIGIDMYLSSDAATGKVIVLDEAHKYMTDTPASKALTESLLSVIRQQRHFGARVLIATQEPTISSRLIDLCSVTIIHRFSSPEWLNVLKKHISISEVDGGDQGNERLFNKIVRLKTGEALIFAPSAILGTVDNAGERAWTAAADELLRVRVRKRVTWDGGRSVVCV